MEAAHTSTVVDETILSRLDLLAMGFSPKTITKGVRGGTLIRLRRDHYVIVQASDSVMTAVRIGGRLTCSSAIAEMSRDVFLFEDDHIHVHAERCSSRLRSADDPQKRWSREKATGIRISWDDLIELPAGRHLVSVVDAVRALIRCRPEREAVATLDSLLRLGLISMRQVREAVAAMPARFRALLTLLDARAESGTESFMRLILRELGVAFEVQVSIGGVGRVDFVVDGFLIIECDSKEFHEGWEKQREDRRRDLAAAAQGYYTLRVLAEDLLYHPARVRDAVRELLLARAAWISR
jgi:very-short-patch-repair endonuclease